MAVNVEGVAVFDDAEVVYVNPVGGSFLVEDGYQVPDEGFVGFVEDTGQGSAYEFDARNNDDCAEDNRNQVVEGLPSAEVDEGKSDQESERAPAVGHQVSSTGLQEHRKGFFAPLKEEVPHEVVDPSGDRGEQDAQVEGVKGLGVKEVVHGFADDAKAGYANEGSLKSGRQKLYLAMAIGVVDVPGTRRKTDAEQRYCSCDDIDDTLQGVRKDSVGVGDPPGVKFNDHQQDADPKGQL